MYASGPKPRPSCQPYRSARPTETAASHNSPCGRTGLTRDAPLAPEVPGLTVGQLHSIPGAWTTSPRNMCEGLGRSSLAGVLRGQGFPPQNSRPLSDLCCGGASPWGGILRQSRLQEADRAGPGWSGHSTQIGAAGAGMGERRLAEASRGEEDREHWAGIFTRSSCQGPRAGSRQSRRPQPSSLGGQNPLSPPSPHSFPWANPITKEPFGANCSLIHLLSKC